MVYDVKKDKQLAGQAVRLSEKEAITIGIHSYNGNEPKLRMNRVRVNKLNEPTYAAIGGMTHAELKAIMPAFAKMIKELDKLKVVTQAQKASITQPVAEEASADTTPVNPLDKLFN